MEIADIIWYDDHGWPFQRSTQQKQKKKAMGQNSGTGPEFIGRAQY